MNGVENAAFTLLKQIQSSKNKAENSVENPAEDFGFLEL